MTASNLPPRKLGLIVLIYVILLVVFNLTLLTPPTVVPSSNQNEFSAQRALEFLNVIAHEPHSSGTKAHADVRDYIVDYCKRQGLETQVLTETGLQVKGSRARAGYTQNILARLKGTSSSKSILVMAHYDSQPNTPGAGDDGSSVAAMMEAIRMLKNQSPLKNDLLFLFTDLEEEGMFGAEAFVNSYDNLKEIGLILNFDDRGNKGPSFTFEVTPNNSWLMNQYAEAIGRSFTNSFAYEVYKLMPNYTDFTLFKPTGIEGFNSGFIDGLSYYHSMADRVENMDLRSLQNSGDILIRSLRHFGNIPLDEPHPQADAIFFNPIANLILIYPFSLDMPLIILTVILFMAVVTLGLKKERISIGKSLVGIALLLGFLIVGLLLVWLFEQGVLSLYPFYSNFDTYNSYNAKVYLICIVGVIMICFLAFYFFWNKNTLSYESYFIGGLFLLIVLMCIMKKFLATGAFVLYYPLITAQAVYLVMILMDIRADKKPLHYAIGQILLMTPALCAWSTLAYMLFITFSHAMPFAAALFTVLCFIVIIPSMYFAAAYSRLAVASIAIALILGGLLIGQINSSYTKQEPLPTNMNYLLDVDTHKAFWASRQNHPDEWMKQFTARREEFEWFGGAKYNLWIGDAPVIPLSTGSVKILKDSTYDGTRNLDLLITGDSSTITIDFTASGAFINRINDRDVVPEIITRVTFSAIPSRGFVVRLQSPPDQPVTLSLVERRMGLPAPLIKTTLPENMIFGPDAFSNTTQVRRKITI